MLSKALLKKVRDITLIDDNRLNVLADCIKRTKDLPGVMAEIGSYKGGSAYLIASLSPKQLYVCDSFEGLPELTEKDIKDKPRHQKGDFTSSFEEVKEFLSPLPNVKIYKGFFPNLDIHSEMYNQMFSFVHLDVDLYQPTLDCLEFFYKRMVTGGIIVTDDYTWIATPGVEKAFTEFFNEKPEKVVNSGFKSAYVVKE